MNFELWRSFESCRTLVLLILFLSLSYSFSSILCNLGEEGSFLLRLVRKVRLTHEGGARREASLLHIFCQTVRNSGEHVCSSCAQVEISLAKQASPLITLTLIDNHPRTFSHEFCLKFRRDVIHRYTRDKGLFHSIQEGGVCCGRLRSSYLLKNGTKVYLREAGLSSWNAIGVNFCSIAYRHRRS